MNKISKKIVSLVTVAAFATTLVPAAAFAVPVGTTNAAEVDVVDNNLVLPEEESTAINVTVGGANLAVGSNDLIFWFMKGDQVATDAEVTLTKADGSTFDYVYPTSDSSGWGTSWFLTNGNVGDVINAEATFAEDGDYTLYVANRTGSEGWTSLQNVIDSDADVAIDTIKVTTPSDYLDVEGSYLLIDDKRTGTATQNETTPVEFVVANSNGYDNALDAGGDVYVWVEDKNGVIVDDATFTRVMDGTNNVYGITAAPQGNGIYKVTGANNGDLLNVMFPDAGEGYTVNLVVAPAGVAAPSIVADNKVQVAPNTKVLDGVTVDVTAADIVTDEIQFNTVEDESAGTATVETANGVTTYTYNYTVNDKVTPNDLKDYKVVGTALNDGQPVENEKLTISCSDSNLTLSTKEVTTNAKGQFEFTFSLKDTGNYTITVSELKDKVVGELNITQNAMAPVDIETAQDNGLMLAGTDDNYIYNQYNYLSEVQFNITDAYDRDATGAEVLSLVAAAHSAWDNHNDFIDVDAPEGSALKDGDIELAWDGSAYTLKYVGDNPTADLVAGDYTVTVSLNNGKDATVHFTLAEFQGAESLDIAMTAAPSSAVGANNNAITAVDDQITLGQNVTSKVYLVDAQGLKIVAPASNLSLGVNGAAVATDSVYESNPFTFTTVPNIPANQSVLGSVITVKVYDEVNKMFVEKELTVVQNYLNETLAFDPVQGPVDTNNAVEISVVDEDGNLSKVNGEVTAYIESQSNEEANITLRANDAVEDGIGRLYLESDAAGTVDVVVAVEAANGEVYAATLTYTFGDEAAADGRYIVMTIGSEQYLINNEIFDGSVDKLGAPYIDDAWRTMVPVRVLAETLGAEVEYADNVVTVVDGDTTVEMTIGEKAYTINGEAAEAEMDTVPVIGDGDRTYVPIRFLTNALGYEVNPLYNAEGLTSSVHFTK